MQLPAGRSFVNKKYNHSYYGSVVWGSICRTNLKKINSQQKHVLRIIFNKSKFEHTSELFKSSKILNVYKLNIFDTAVFMHKIQGKYATSIFLPKFRKPSHSYPARFSHLNYVKPIPKLKNVNMEFRTEDHLSGIIFSVPRINKSQMSLNLKL